MKHFRPSTPNDRLQKKSSKDKVQRTKDKMNKW